MKAVVICNGSITDYEYMKKYLREARLLICADGGARHARAFGVRPDVLLGDFDSISEEVLKAYRAEGIETVTFPSEKDMTDTELAAEYAVSRGCTEITFLAAIGTRMDHSLANIFLLKKLLEKGITGVIADEHNEITLIKDEIRLEREDARITLLPLSQRVNGVNTEGLYYTLKDAMLEMGTTWGVSNEFAADKASVTIKDGLLLIMKSRD